MLRYIKFYGSVILILIFNIYDGKIVIFNQTCT